MAISFPESIQTLKVSGGHKKTVYFPRVINMAKQKIEGALITALFRRHSSLSINRQGICRRLWKK
jgi:hypothetical protein